MPLLHPPKKSWMIRSCYVSSLSLFIYFTLSGFGQGFQTHASKATTGLDCGHQWNIGSRLVCKRTSWERIPNGGALVSVSQRSAANTSSGGLIDSNEAESNRPWDAVRQKTSDFASRNSFVLGMIFAVSLARAFPKLGADFGVLRPELVIGKYGVAAIFLISGLSLELTELRNAATHHSLNVLVQAVSFLMWPYLVGVPMVRALRGLLPGLLPEALLDGILILTCLPTTINMCILLTSAANASVATSLCNAVISNLLGIFATPALLMRFFGGSIELPFSAMVGKLCSKVLLPVTIGQVLRATRAKSFYIGHKKAFKQLQEVLLLGIVWNAFCNAFTGGFGLDVRSALFLLVLLPTMHLSVLLGLFSVFKSGALKFTRGETVAAAFCASHKTLALGLPLVKTVFEGNPNMAAYCAPIMFIHPLQLIIGSLLVPQFSKYISEEDLDDS